MLLNQAARAHKISETGKQAFLAAVDPFHDKPIDGLRGWPDLETGPSVVRHWKQSSTVRSPEEGGAIAIYTYPILDQSDVAYASRTGNNITTMTSPDGSLAGGMSPLMIYTYTEAVAQAGYPINGAGVTEKFEHYVPADYFVDGPGRLIGMGFEVRDVTAELYKQGTLTCFEIPQNVADKELAIISAQTLSGISYLMTPVEFCSITRFPLNLGDVMKFPNTQQWDAKEGAYVVVPFTSHENPPLYAQYRVPWIDTAPASGAEKPGFLGTGAVMTGMYEENDAAGGFFRFTPHAYAPVHSKGVILTGLNANSTFTITTTFYFETFPQQASPLLPLAQVSAPYDPKALALIQLVMQRLPVGVPVKDNGSGEWFWEAIETAIPVLGSVASVLFPEFSPIIAGASAIARNAVQRERKKKSKKSEKKQIAAEVKKDVAALVRKKG